MAATPIRWLESCDEFASALRAASHNRDVSASSCSPSARRCRASFKHVGAHLFRTWSHLSGTPVWLLSSTPRLHQDPVMDLQLWFARHRVVASSASQRPQDSSQLGFVEAAGILSVIALPIFNSSGSCPVTGGSAVAVWSTTDSTSSSMFTDISLALQPTRPQASDSPNPSASFAPGGLIPEHGFALRHKREFMRLQQLERQQDSVAQVLSHLGMIAP